MRVLLGAFGDPGHVFPVLALGRELVRRGHEAAVYTWDRWQPAAEAEGLGFLPAPEYPTAPDRPLSPYQAAVRATRELQPALEALAPDAVVADVLTLAPALAAERAGVPWATLVPHVWHVGAPGLPPYAVGARAPRTRVGARLWEQVERVTQQGLVLGREELNGARTRLDLPPLDRFHGGLSPHLCLVATFPQLEYPRAWPASVHVVGPLFWEQPTEDVAVPPGDGPLVLVAPSTVQDGRHALLQSALAGLAGEPVRVLATWNRRPAPAGIRVDVPANARLVEWVSYAQVMPQADVVVSHAGHGTVARALAAGAAVVACPDTGDMFENAARVDWAGVGVRVPRRLVGPRVLRLAVRRALAEPGLRERARELAAWAAAHDGAARAAALVEELVEGGGASRRPRASSGSV